LIYYWSDLVEIKIQFELKCPLDFNDFAKKWNPSIKNCFGSPTAEVMTKNCFVNFWSKLCQMVGLVNKL
jgi:hypothetical protein